MRKLPWFLDDNFILTIYLKSALTSRRWFHHHHPMKRSPLFFNHDSMLIIEWKSPPGFSTMIPPLSSYKKVPTTSRRCWLHDEVPVTSRWWFYHHYRMEKSPWLLDDMIPPSSSYEEVPMTSRRCWLLDDASIITTWRNPHDPSSLSNREATLSSREEFRHHHWIIFFSVMISIIIG